MYLVAHRRTGKKYTMRVDLKAARLKGDSAAAVMREEV